MKKWLRVIIIFTTASGLIASIISTLMSERPILYTISLLKYFTIWSNIFLCLYMIYRPKKYKIFEKTKGGIYINITITMVVFISLLSGTWEPSGVGAYSNLMHHYISPVLAILFLVLYERDSNTTFNDAKKWLVFPLGYLVFAIFICALTGDPVYPFLDIEHLGFGVVSLIVLAIFFFYLILSFGIVKIVSRK